MVKRSSTMTKPAAQNERQSLREQVDTLLPNWQSWYPSLFEAAQDLGLIRARVCAPSALMLANRHAGVQSEAVEAFKRQWSVEDEPELAPVVRIFPPRPRRPLKRRKKGRS